MKRTLNLMNGDCVEKMKELEDNSVDAILCDPPYGLKFMNKDFDDLGEGKQQREWHVQWVREAFRVLKPNGVMKAFGGTRTYQHCWVRWKMWVSRIFLSMSGVTEWLSKIP